MMQPREQIDWAERLSRLNIPTLLVHGDRDAFYAMDTMMYAQTLIPGSQLVVMEGSGHLPTMVRPQDVADAINAFFDGKV